jgi:hypothetical protein
VGHLTIGQRGIQHYSVLGIYILFNNTSILAKKSMHGDKNIREAKEIKLHPVT